MSVALTVLPPLIRNPHADGPAAWLPDSSNTGPLNPPIAFDS
jgi:hypothetical protein